MTPTQSLPEPPPPNEERAHRGQILIMFAFMLAALLGALGLSVDLGMAFSQRRTMQSAADAGAYAGAWAVLKSTATQPKYVQSEVNTVVNQNTMNFGTITSIQCEYINDASQSLGNCSGGIPSSASGRPGDRPGESSDLLHQGGTRRTEQRHDLRSRRRQHSQACRQ